MIDRGTRFILCVAVLLLLAWMSWLTLVQPIFPDELDLETRKVVVGE